MIICKKCKVGIEEYPYHYKCPKCHDVFFLDEGGGLLQIKIKQDKKHARRSTIRTIIKRKSHLS